VSRWYVNRNGFRLGRLTVCWRDAWPPTSYGLEVIWWDRRDLRGRVLFYLWSKP
jgi:hypothetical protein